jgi:hypothetical protein
MFANPPAIAVNAGHTIERAARYLLGICRPL